MALSDRKITDSQISTNGVVSAPDELKGTIPQNKAVFDKLIKETVKTQLNGLIDDLTATTGAAQIGASAPAGLTGANIQALLNALNTAATAHTGSVSNPHDVTKAQVGLGNVDNTSDVGKPVSIAQQAAIDLKVDKVAGKGLSTNDYDNAEKAKVAQIDSKANTSDVLTKTNTTAFTPTADYHPCTKVYADNIAAAAGAVTSVFGRAGAVTAQTGDYTPEQVGAAPTNHTHTKDKITDFPTSMPANGGNAATVGGKLPSEFATYTVADKNLNNMAPDPTGFYKGSFTGLPTSMGDGQGTLQFINYDAGTSGWCTQIFYSAHGFAPIIRKFTNGSILEDWQRLSDGGNASTINWSNISIQGAAPSLANTNDLWIW